MMCDLLSTEQVRRLVPDAAPPTAEALAGELDVGCVWAGSQENVTIVAFNADPAAFPHETPQERRLRCCGQSEEVLQVRCEDVEGLGPEAFYVDRHRTDSGLDARAIEWIRGAHWIQVATIETAAVDGDNLVGLVDLNQVAIEVDQAL